MITYDGLPVSRGGGHVLRARGLVAAWARIEDFLRRCSDFEQPSGLVIELIEAEAASSAFAASLKRRLSSAHPRLRSRRIGAAVGHRWSVESRGLPDLLHDLEGLDPLSAASIVQPTLHVVARFRLVDPRTGARLPFQDPSYYLMRAAGDQRLLGTSCAFARLSARSTMSLFLSLPFTEPDAECRAYVNFLMSTAPVRLSSHHWKRWLLNRRGTRYVGRRVVFDDGAS